MPRFLPFALALAALVAAPAVQAQTCQPIPIVWPSAENPIWELDAYPVSLSTGPDGSGLEIRNVRYRGRTVLKRGHVPILNVRYVTGCNCFRDWMRSNTRFISDNTVGACHSEPEPGTVQTMCDVGVQSSDIGSFQGIAVEREADSFTLTTQSSAGWYRYKMSWTFERDGTIRPEFGFSNTTNSCALNPRRHYAYWRLDFDIETAGGNRAAESRGGQLWETLPAETSRLWDHPDETLAPTMWAVFNNETGRGYSITPGELEYLTPANPGTGNPTIDNFAREDIVFSRYREGQLTDNRACSANFTGGSNPIVQGEDITDHDIVVWYRTGATKVGGHDEVCYPLGPVIRPLGDWGQFGTTAEEGATPAPLALEAFPNPFDRTTTVRFTLDQPQAVTVTLYDGLGRPVRTLYEGAASGTHEVRVEGAGLPAGAYTVRLLGEGGLAATTRVVLIR